MDVIKMESDHTIFDAAKRSTDEKSNKSRLSRNEILIKTKQEKSRKPYAIFDG